MTKRKLIHAIARRLPFMTTNQVSEVLDVAAELWCAELLLGEVAQIPGIGTLRIEVQEVEAGGAVHGRLRRVYGRYRLSGALREKLEADDDE
jgi:nucleoid DNA-binding protein